MLATAELQSPETDRKNFKASLAGKSLGELQELYQHLMRGTDNLDLLLDDGEVSEEMAARDPGFLGVRLDLYNKIVSMR